MPATMHGLIHSELKAYVEATLGSDAWNALAAQLGLAHKHYVPVGIYPDTDAVAVIDAAARLSHRSTDELLEDFGRFIAPTLLGMYARLIAPEWKTMELLLNTETTIHQVVRRREVVAEPPRLRFERAGPAQLTFRYDSPRRLASLARGIMEGVAAHYGERIEIVEDRKPDNSSEMSITIRPA
jgi:hypothetical protein